MVDAEPDTRALLKLLLQHCDAVVTTAASASEALEALRGAKPDVVISDIGMPGVDGYALIRMLRALPPNEGGDIPAVALTAYARSDDRTRALLSGFQSHVAKPVEAMELVATLASLAHRPAAGKSAPQPGLLCRQRTATDRRRTLMVSGSQLLGLGLGRRKHCSFDARKFGY